MQGKQFLLIALILAALLVLSMQVNLLESLFFALSKAVYSGYSTGKLIAAFAWFIAITLLGFTAVKLDLCKKAKKMEKIAITGFLGCIATGLLLGGLQFELFREDYFPRWHFGTIIYEEDYKNWQASKFYHNHHPKATLYFISSSLGLEIGQDFDDGRPLFELMPEAGAYSAVYSFLLATGFLFFLMHFLAVAGKINAKNFFFLTAGGLGLIVYMIDGGLASVPIGIIYFFIASYLLSNYQKKFIGSEQATIALAAAISLSALGTGVFGYYLPMNVFQVFLLLAVYAAYAFFLEALPVIKNKKISIKWKKENKKQKAKIVFFIALFFVSIAMTTPTMLTYTFGKQLVDYSELGYDNMLEGAGLYMYGLPADLPEDILEEFLTHYGKVIELNKTGWVAFARILPEKPVSEREIENALKEKFEPQTYLYAMETAPSNNISTVHVYWETETDSKEFIRDRFVDIRIIERVEKGTETVLIIETHSMPTWQLLTVLTEIKENGHKGKILVAQ